MTDEAKALVERLREEEIIQYCDDGSYITRRFNRDGKEAADLIETQAREIERLRDLMCLADELLMEAKGAFPLPGNPLREAYLKIRAVSGDDYHARKNRARAALGESHD